MKQKQLESQHQDDLQPIQEKSEPRQKVRAGFEDQRPETAQLAQLKEKMSGSGETSAPIQPKANKTGLPDQLKSGVENLSGFAMDDVKVHYNSSKPTQLKAHAYAQGTDIHLAPGQEKHLPHEAWHVVQQKQGRVKPTMQMKGKVPVNDDAGLEQEADVMGAKALQNAGSVSEGPLKEGSAGGAGVHQMEFDEEGDKEKLRKVHQWFLTKEWEAYRKDDWPTVIYNGIYKRLGYEENSVYDTPAGEAGRVTNAKFLSQNRRKIVAKKLEKVKDVDEASMLKALKRKLKKYRPNEEESKFINPLAHEKGDYFHIKRPSNIATKVKALQTGNGDQAVMKERLILNINSASVAAGLLEYILAGWEAEAMDWRSRVTSAKFLGMSPEARANKPDLKFDKVVIYYERVDRDSVVDGAGGMVPHNDRNEGISAFYNKLDKGLGVGEEKVDKLGSSFTTRRTNTILRWAMDDKGLDEVCAMGEEEFVDEVLPLVRSQMLPADVQEATPIRPMSMDHLFEPAESTALLDGLTQGIGLSQGELNALLDSLSR